MGKRRFEQVKKGCGAKHHSLDCINQTSRGGAMPEML
ncbi:hypothetical protein YpsIP31758_B0094 (plasmid) [Yersinia pseudotuberculosis IP 31758]|uniref:Uncharacterized protein n=1 Tax=Yersinia pseudotuberculosis serotype O:1b (strain IP 31758) TaxID=349747 RepID=A0A0U1QTD0_YERP3|nr:hypothetical protein YpsIP31758_B0094 [Yersinia pseudotuberculosis IP 31758]